MCDSDIEPEEDIDGEQQDEFIDSEDADLEEDEDIDGEQEDMELDEDIDGENDDLEDDEEMDSQNLPRHLRHRYWDAAEELFLAEMWGRHMKEIVTLSENAPVFRKIADGMRDRGVHVNPQECRRQIRAMHTKYIAELNNMNLTKKSSGWRLFPIIKAILSDPNIDFDAEQRCVNEVLAEMEARQAPKISNTTESEGEIQNKARPKTSFIFKGRFTMAAVEELRKNNICLQEEINKALRHLQVEESQIEIMTSAFQYWCYFVRKLKKHIEEKNAITLSSNTGGFPHMQNA